MTCSEDKPISKSCSMCKGSKLLSEFEFTHELDDKRASICKHCMTEELEEASYENWDRVAQVCDLIEKTLQQNHVQFGGELGYSNVEVTAACYVIIERLSSNFVNHFGTEAIEPTINRLNTFQDALVLNLEKFRNR